MALSAEEGARRLRELLFNEGEPRKKNTTASTNPLPQKKIIGIATEEELRERARLRKEVRKAVERKGPKRARNYKGPTTILCPCGVSFEVENHRKDSAKYHTRECAELYRKYTKPNKWVFTPEMDERLRVAYRDTVGMSRRPVVRELAEEFDMPRWKVSRRASSLGLVNTLHFQGGGRPGAWTETEKEIVRKNAHRSIEHISRKLKASGFERSPNAVKIFIARHMGPKPKENYSATALAKLFGIDSHSITRWIKQGYLKAGTAGTARTPQQGGDAFAIRPEDVREFMVSHLSIIDFRKVDKFWVVEILTGKEIDLTV